MFIEDIVEFVNKFADVGIKDFRVEFSDNYLHVYTKDNLAFKTRAGKAIGPVFVHNDEFITAVNLGVSPDENVLLRKMMADEDVKNAILEIGKMVCKCGNERDFISIAGDIMFIGTSKDEHTLNYMNNIPYDRAFNTVYSINTKHKHGLVLRYIDKNLNIPPTIMTVDRLWRRSEDVQVRFKVSTLDVFGELVIDDFGLGFSKEVLK